MARTKNERRTCSLLIMISLMLTLVVGCGATKKQREIADSQLLMGIAYLGERQDTQALRCFLEAEKADPNNERIHYFKSFVYVNREDFADAKASLQKAVGLNNTYSQAHTLLGSLYLRAGEQDKAMSHFQEALNNPIYDAPAAALYNIGWVFFQKGENQQAINACLRALAIDPESPLRASILEMLGGIYLQEKNYPKALTCYQEAARLTPQNMKILIGLAQARLGNGDKGAARQLLARIIAVDKVGDAAAKAHEILNKSR